MFLRKLQKSYICIVISKYIALLDSIGVGYDYIGYFYLYVNPLDSGFYLF
ncbi:hypothetical protein EZS27_011414 [termite gut metagenome]|uniref:Uncharacterized protein n=1 Tax=termite gut metagenome TaxID=433724 RepID=A0A5J4S666_9ZZZZ